MMFSRLTSTGVRIGVFVVIAILIYSAYSNTFESPFVLDDFHSFVRNPDLHDISINNILRLVQNKFGLARFIPMASFALDYWWGNGKIQYFHITNFIIHVLGFFAVLGLVRSIVLASSSDCKCDNKRHFTFCFAVAAAWALHPAQTSAVTYLVQRMASLQALFFTTSVAAFLQARIKARCGRKQSSKRWSVLCALAACCAFLSKENSAMLPVMWIVCEIWFFRRDLSLRTIGRVFGRIQTYKVFLACGLILVPVLWGSVALVGYFSSGYSNRHFTMAERLLTESRVVLHYIYAITVPNPEILSIEHDIEVSSSLLSPPSTLASTVVIMAMLYFSFWKRNKYPLITFGMIWFFLNLVIESTIVPLELMFDHRMYLSSIGLIIAIVDMARLIASKFLLKYSEMQRRRLAWSTLAIACSLLALLTFYRNEDWRDIITINRDAVEKAPNNPRAHANYSVALVRAGRYEEGIAEARKAIGLGRPGFEDYVVAATSILSAYMQQGQWLKAIESAEKLLTELPDKYDATSLPVFYLKLADCYRVAGQYRDCYAYVMKANEIIKEHPRLSVNRKWIYVELASLFEDVQSLQEDIDGDGLPDPGPLSPDEWIAQKLYDLEDYDGALLFAQRVPESPVAQSVLRRIALFKDRTGEQERRWSFAEKYLERPWSISNITLGVSYAIRRYEVVRALRPFGERLLNGLLGREPLNPDAYLLSGWYAFEDGDYERAVASAKKAIELDPQYAKAWIALGFFAQKKGDVATSLTAFRQTLELYPGYPKRDVLEELMARLEASAVATPEAEKEPVQGAA